MPKQYQHLIIGENCNDYDKLMACANYVSRMTDTFALQQYKIFSGIDM